MGRHRKIEGDGQAADVKDDLVRAALRLFEQQGYHATSVQEIVDGARLTKGAFYHYFDSKEDLLHLLHDEFIDYELETGRAILEQYSSAKERLSHLLEAILVSVDRYLSNVTVFFQERRFLSSKAFTRIRQKRDQFQGMLEEVIAQGIASGEFRADLDPKIVTLALFGMCAWTYQWYRRTGPLQMTDIANMYVSLVLQGLEP